MIIYKLENLINGKIYIGQTNDFSKRLNGHKSNSTNKKSHSYNLPLYSAIRKYGWDSFSKEIIEERNDFSNEEDAIEWANERESYYIDFYNSTKDKRGYNISLGGGQAPRPNMTKEDQNKVIQDILSGMYYKEISKKWGISQGLISMINNGSIWKDDNLNYPLVIKGSSRLHNYSTWVKDVIYDLENTDLNLLQISQKYKKSYSTIKKINSGSSYRDNNKKYPLTKNR